MEIKDILKDYKLIEKKGRKKTERGELILEFMNAVNAERGKKFALLDYARMARLLKGKSISELYGFLSQCNDRKVRNGSFSRYFWWSLKDKKK